jgi:hypothetical protein
LEASLRSKVRSGLCFPLKHNKNKQTNNPERERTRKSGLLLLQVQRKNKEIMLKARKRIMKIIIGVFLFSNINSAQCYDLLWMRSSSDIKDLFQVE